MNIEPPAPAEPPPGLADDHPIAVWHRLVRSADPTGLDALLDADAVFHSPVVHTPQRGRALAAAYLGAAFKVFFNPTFRYVRKIVGPTDAMLEFETVIDGVRINGVDLIRWNAAGRIVEFKVMIRPLKAIQLIHERMGAMLRGGAAAPPRQSIGLVALVVPDYDEALAFYVGVLGFTLLEDVPVPAQDKRWVVVAPPGARESRLLLARAATPAQTARIGDQTGGRVFLFLTTDDLARDHRRYRDAGVVFVREPAREPYGTVAVFRDPWGNLWDLIEPATPPR